MDQGDLEGMQTFDGVIERMIREGVVSKEDGVSYASNQGNLLLRLADMGSASSGAPNKQSDGAGGNSMLDMIE
ncbi:MAG TPA: hypothetical protein VGV59_06440, partial [Pyrinomonadaceae bacterium]|nr:hypothetical protein [Pyrinomonadaceae bacterium]